MGAGDRITAKWEIGIDPKRDWLSKYWRKLFDADQYKTGFKPPKHHLVFHETSTSFRQQNASLKLKVLLCLPCWIWVLLFLRNILRPCCNFDFLCTANKLQATRHLYEQEIKLWQGERERQKNSMKSGRGEQRGLFPGRIRKPDFVRPTAKVGASEPIRNLEGKYENKGLFLPHTIPFPRKES